jgi:hypothetical protein
MPDENRIRLQIEGFEASYILLGCAVEIFVPCVCVCMCVKEKENVLY